jgi:integrase
MQHKPENTNLRSGPNNGGWSKEAIVGFIRKSRRIHEFPIARHLLFQIPVIRNGNRPIFPELYSDSEKQLNDRLGLPRRHMQDILKANDRPHATLHSFRVTYNNNLRDLGLSIEDRQILLAHSSSETTKIYTHPNFDKAQNYVNQLPEFGVSTTKNVHVLQNVTKT